MEEWCFQAVLMQISHCLSPMYMFSLAIDFGST
jgi:hypothetical protein